MKLTDRKWKSFDAFGENGLFDIHTTSSGIDKNKLVSDNNDNNTAPYVTRSGGANGVAGFVDPKNYKYGFDPANVITIGLDTQTAFYQPHKFITGQNIHVITGEKLTPLVIQFLLPLFRTQMVAKFNWGGNGATLSRMKRLRLMLPIDDNGQPDYDFMSDYVRERLSQKRQSYLDYVHDRLAELGTVQSLPAINSVDWKPFVISELFSKLVGGKGKGLVHLRQVDSGGIEYLGATNRNNGVLCRVALDDVSKPMVQSGNCIGFIKNGDGAAGYAVYKKEPFISTTDVIYGYADWLNPYTGLFFVGSQDLIRPKYGHGYKRNARHLRVDKVMLPAMSDGTPDYKYMEQYVKNKMIQKYNNYLQYINAR